MHTFGSPPHAQLLISHPFFSLSCLNQAHTPSHTLKQPSHYTSLSIGIHSSHHKIYQRVLNECKLSIRRRCLRHHLCRRYRKLNNIYIHMTFVHSIILKITMEWHGIYIYMTDTKINILNVITGRTCVYVRVRRVCKLVGGSIGL